MATTKVELLNFEGQENGENIVFVLRAHGITNLPWILITIFFLLSPLFLRFFINFTQIFEIDFASPTVLLTLLVFDLIVLGFAFQSFLHWYFNTYILTNLRIIDIDFSNLFYRNIAQAILTNIEDVSFRKGGIFQNFFDYGDVQVQTAGEMPNFEFSGVPDPEGVQKQILNLVIEAKAARR